MGQVERTGGAISLRITQGLEEVRKTWFQACVDNFLETSKKGASEGPPIVVKRANLAGDAARASKAYQLYLVSGFLAQHGYIPRVRVETSPTSCLPKSAGPNLSNACPSSAGITRPRGIQGRSCFGSAPTFRGTSQATTRRSSNRCSLLGHFQFLLR